MPTKEQTLLIAARRLSASATSGTELSNALFDPETGLVVKAYQTREARETFMRTPEFKEIQELVDAAIEHDGLLYDALASITIKDLLAAAQPHHPEGHSTWKDEA